MHKAMTNSVGFLSPHGVTYSLHSLAPKRSGVLQLILETSRRRLLRITKPAKATAVNAVVGEAQPAGVKIALDQVCQAGFMIRYPACILQGGFALIKVEAQHTCCARQRGRHQCLDHQSQCQLR